MKLAEITDTELSAVCAEIPSQVSPPAGHVAGTDGKRLIVECDSVAETRALAGRLAQVVARRLDSAARSEITLQGELGSGKTTFVQGFCAGLDITGKVTSPTFTLMHIYHSERVEVYHFDFYRLDSTAEVAALGIDDYLDAGGISLIEWPELAWSLLPFDPLLVKLSIPDLTGQPERRLIEIARNPIGKLQT